MVFEFHHLKLPGAIAHPTQRPCLEDVLLLWGGCALWPRAHSQSGSRLSKHGFHSGSPSRWADSAKTMYRTHAAFEGVGAADSISLDCAFLRGVVNPLGAETMLSGFAARVGCGSHGASMVLSMVFGCCGLFPLELCSLLERKPCLAGLRPSGGLCRPLYTFGSVFAKHGFLFLLD